MNRFYKTLSFIPIIILSVSTPGHSQTDSSGTDMADFRRAMRIVNQLYIEEVSEDELLEGRN